MKFQGRYVESEYKEWKATFRLRDCETTTIESHLYEERWKSICKNIEENPERYFVQKTKSGEGILFYQMDYIPSPDEDLSFTGYKYLVPNGDWVLEDDQCDF